MKEAKIYLPAEVDYDENRLDAVDAHFLRLMNDKAYIQSVNYCLSRYGKVFANKAIGKQSFKTDDARKLKVDAIHRIASISKFITAAAMFKLFEDGYLRPLQFVSEVLPEFKKAPFDKITIANLLTHTSGLYPDGGSLSYEFTDYWEFISQKKENETWVQAALKGNVLRKPNEQWAYCTFGFCILGEIITRTVGYNCEDYIRKVIFEPCQMSDTFFGDEISFGKLSSEFVKKFTENFYIQNDEDFELVQNCKNYKEGQTQDWISEEVKKIWYAVPGTSSDIMSTAEDLNKFGRMLVNNGIADDGTRVLGRKAIERMIENCTESHIVDNCWTATGTYRMYALGPDTRRTADNHYSKGTYFHEGAGACCLVVDPVEKMVASWFVPWAVSDWYADPLYNASTVMWSGIK